MLLIILANVYRLQPVSICNSFPALHKLIFVIFAGLLCRQVLRSKEEV